MPKIQFILRSHNEKRNQIASGHLPNYQSAAKMPVMVSNQVIVEFETRPKYLIYIELFQSGQYWDPELAYLAELNARTCVFHHDQCHKTGVKIFLSNSKSLDWFNLDIFIHVDRHPWSGQNIAYRGSTGGYEDPNTAIGQMIDSWFIEYRDAGMRYIHSYPEHEPRY